MSLLTLYWLCSLQVVILSINDIVNFSLSFNNLDK